VRAGLNAGAKEGATEARRAQRSRAFAGKGIIPSPAMFSAHAFFRRIRTPYESFLAVTAVVPCVMGCVEDQRILGLFCALLLWVWCSYALIYSGLEAPKQQVESLHWSLRQMFMVTACLAVIIGAIFNHWPMLWRFAISVPEMDRIADQVESGLEVKKPQAVGLFVIEKATMRSGIPCLWIDGETCFARCKPEQVQGFNLWSTERMNDRWQLILED